MDDSTTEMTNGTYVDRSLSRITVGEWSRKWLETKTDLKATTRRDYENLAEVAGLVVVSSPTTVGVAGLDGLIPHGLRHTAVSLVIAANGRQGRTDDARRRQRDDNP